MTEKYPFRFNQEQREVSNPPDSIYKILSGHDDGFRGEVSGESLRARYVHLTDQLIQRVICGPEASTVDPANFNKILGDVEQIDNPYKLKPYYDSVIFLDKSARPVEWLFRALWDHLSEMPDGTRYEKPETLFVNIDRIFWSNIIDPERVDNREIRQADSSIHNKIHYLRAVFAEHTRLGADQSLDMSYGKGTKPRVLIVDEVRSSGRTLAYATEMFKAAFPDVDFEGYHWMGATTTNGSTAEGDFVYGDGGVPVWYQDNTYLGRGVGDPNRPRAKHESSDRNKGRAHFLSTRLEPHERESSDQLRREIKLLAEAVKRHEVLVRPSIFYNSEAYLLRAQQLNPQYKDIEKLVGALRDMGQTWTIKPKK